MGTPAKTTPPPASKQPATKTKKVIRVLCATEGYRRAGFAFGPTAKDFDIEDLTPEKLRQLQADPKLVVAFVDVPVEQPADQAEGADT